MTGPAPALGNWPSLDAIADDVRECVKCRLSEGRTRAVPGSGSPSAAIMFIGEGPGFNEDQQGLPFVGRAGNFLDELLAQVPLARDDVYITNVVKCRPPDNRDPMPDEVEACMPYLNAQIARINPRVIVTLGRHSLLRFYPGGRISQDHGKILRWNGRILFPLYHPAAGLRNPGVADTLREDMRRLPEALLQSLADTGEQDRPGATEEDAAASGPREGREQPHGVTENGESSKPMKEPQDAEQQLGLF